MKFKEAVKDANKRMSESLMDLRRDAVWHTKNNWYWIKKGFVDLGILLGYWLIFFVITILYPFLYVYAVIIRMVKK